MGAGIKAKVLIRSMSIDGEESVETVWAEQLSADTYRTENVPLFAYGISLHDEVLAPFDQTSGFAVFERVLSKSDSRTLRLHLRRPLVPNGRIHKKLLGLVELGCGYEFANNRFIALNVPASLDTTLIEKRVERITTEWERGGPAYED